MGSCISSNFDRKSVRPIENSREKSESEFMLASVQNSLRLKILEDLNFSLNEKKIIFLFGPPIFPSQLLAEFIAVKMDLPILVSKNRTGLNMLASKMEDSRDHEGGYGIEEYEYLSFELRKGVYDEGFVMYDCPKTLKQLDQLSQLSGCTKYEAIYLSVSKQMNRFLRNRWNMWIHPASGRMYHLIYSPPRSALPHLSQIEEIVRKGQSPDLSILLDDKTNEPLKVISNAMHCNYLDILAKYESTSLNPNASHFRAIGHVIKCEAELKDVERKVVLALSQIAGKVPLTGYRPTFSNSSCSSNISRGYSTFELKNQQPLAPPARREIELPVVRKMAVRKMQSL